MDTLQAIHTRVTVVDFKKDLPDRSLIEQILETGTRAPNYHLTEPWRFFVLAGDGRGHLAQAIAESRRQSFLKKGKNPESQEALARIEYEKNLAYDAPVYIVVAIVPQFHKSPIVKEYEELLAGGAAVQNMLLAAHALGLGAMWRTAGFNEKPIIKSLFGLEEKDTIIGFLRVGYPTISIQEQKIRTSFKQKTEWWGW